MLSIKKRGVSTRTESEQNPLPDKLPGPVPRWNNCTEGSVHDVAVAVPSEVHVVGVEEEGDAAR